MSDDQLTKEEEIDQVTKGLIALWNRGYRDKALETIKTLPPVYTAYVSTMLTLYQACVKDPPLPSVTQLIDYLYPKIETLHPDRGAEIIKIGDIGKPKRSPNTRKRKTKKEKEIAEKQKRIRDPHCYHCKADLHSKTDSKCGACGWLVCSGCGACGCSFEG